MGQSASSPSSPTVQAPVTSSRSRARSARQSVASPRESPRSDDSHTSTDAQRRRRTLNANRLSRMFDENPVRATTDDHSNAPSRPSLSERFRRSRSSILAGHGTSRLFSRGGRVTEIVQAQDEETRSNRAVEESERPHVSLPDISIADFDFDLSTPSNGNTTTTSTQRSSSRRSSTRLANTLTDRLAGLRTNRQTTTTTNTVLRRRRSANGQPEDNTALLSRLLAVAAAATAATLLEGSEHSISDARGTAGDGDDGTFDSFLQSLERGRLAAALRQGAQQSQEAGSGHPPLNFFRMFRFGANATTRSTRANSATDGRMVPIIIVGIRAVTPGSAANGSDDNGVPPFLDALSTLPTTPFNANSLGQDIADGLRGSPHGARLGRQRRTSLSGYDNQRHHTAPALTRARSTGSTLASWPQPPPVTPASADLSAVTSRNMTPAPTAATSRRSSYSSTAARRESIIRTTTTTTLETTTEDSTSPSRATRPRRGSDSEHRNSAYASRRNGIVEPDAALPENTRSWIIYVLGGSYPENHPILTTPSLFTDSPTYEDMTLLAQLLGPAKPPVATENDIAAAGGTYRIQIGQTDAKALVAVADSGAETLEIGAEQRCLVCLCDFEKDEEARKLTKCGHLYHRECIDEWLTKGRNSCPLCRAQGVEEQKQQAKKAESAPPVDSARPSPILPSSETVGGPTPVLAPTTSVS